MRSDTDIQNLFQDLYQSRDDLNAPEYFHYFTKSMAEGLWKDYEALLVKFPGSLVGKDFVDFGCKYRTCYPSGDRHGRAVSRWHRCDG